MENIKFIPKEFHDVKLGYYETKESPCSPIFFNEMRTVNSININTPQKIICKNIDNNVPVIIPICALYSISLRRWLKYNKLSAKMLHIRKVGEETIYSGEIVDKDESLIMLPPNYDLMVKQHKERVEEAQKYSDDELEQSGLAAINYLNINILEYVDIPLQTGKYEIYLSFCGLESNHTIVEIIIDQF